MNDTFDPIALRYASERSAARVRAGLPTIDKVVARSLHDSDCVVRHPEYDLDDCNCSRSWTEAEMREAYGR